MKDEIFISRIGLTFRRQESQCSVDLPTFQGKIRKTEDTLPAQVCEFGTAILNKGR
jgi:hypothetical protein